MTKHKIKAIYFWVALISYTVKKQSSLTTHLGAESFQANNSRNNAKSAESGPVDLARQ